jgi:serine/threonine protein kinase
MLYMHFTDRGAALQDHIDRLRAALADRYAIEDLLGRGGMATVYLAQDVKHGRRVAVKVLKPDLAAAVGSERFLREIEIVARLTHPHILPLHDSGEADGLLYYVMPFVSGGSLRTRLNQDKTIELSAALRIVSEVAGALTYAHKQGIVHRDVKPENILLAEGHAVVADFGIAKALSAVSSNELTRSGFPLGTIGYMSPEQAAGNTELTGSTDVFSLACACYEMVVGDVPGSWPWEASVSRGQFLDAPASHRAKLALLPAPVEPALTRALALRPADRCDKPDPFAAVLVRPAGQTPQYGNADVRRIVQRAAELELERPSQTGAMSLGSVQQIAAEVGIPSKHVREAARILSESERAVNESWLYGAPEALTVERTVAGEVTAGDHPLLVERLRDLVGYVGNTNTLGSSLEWSSTAGHTFWHVDRSRGPGQVRDTHVAVTPHDGRTRIVVREQLQPVAQLTYAMTTAAVVAPALLGALLVSDSFGVGAGVFTVAAVFAGSFGFARSFIKRLAGKRRTQLRAMADELAQEVAGLTSAHQD